MSYKNYALVTQGTMGTSVTGFTGDKASFNGTYALQDASATGKQRVWYKSDESTISFNAATGSNRWEISKVTTKASIVISPDGETSVTYYRDTDYVPSYSGVYAWYTTASTYVSRVFTDTETPTASSTSCYTDESLYDWYATVNSYAAAVVTIAAYSTDAQNDPVDCSWSVTGLQLSGAESRLLLCKAAAGYEIVSLSIELYNQADTNGNITIYKYNASSAEIFEFTIGLQSAETIAIDHKIVVPEGFSVYVSSSVYGIRVCMNACESKVV